MSDAKMPDGQLHSKPSKPFVLLSVGRTGTNFLISKLLSTNQIVFGWEPFNKTFLGYGIPDCLSVPQDVASRLNNSAFRDNDPDGYITYCAGLTGSFNGTKVKSSGFKIFPAHNSDVYWKMTRDTRFRVLVLERRSILAVYSSLEIAKKTKVWIVSKDNKQDKGKQIKTTFIPADFENFSMKYKNNFKDTLINLQQAGVEYRHYYYEDLVRDPACFPSILDFLKIESEATGETWVTKQNDPNVLNRFSNPGDALPYLKMEQLEDADQKRRMQVRTEPKKIFIHIGKPRTATTSFQTGICKAAGKLKESGLYVPKSGRVGDRHMQLVWASSPETVAKLHPWHSKNYDGRTVEEHVQMVMDEAQDHQAVLLSSEWFSIFPDLCFSRMVDAFSSHGGEVTALVTLRDQADTIYSSYMQQLQAKTLVPSLENFGPSWAEYGKVAAPLDHHVLLRNWSSMCRVRAFWFGPQICERIMAETGFPDIADFSRENSSVPFELSRFVRAEAEKPIPPKDWNAFIERIQKDPSQFAEHADPTLLEAADAVRTRIRSRFADSNAKLEAEFGYLITE